MGEALVFLNRVGVTAEQARYDLAPWEVEGLLLSQLAQREAWREEEEPERKKIPVIENQVGEAAPSWVEQLDVE